MTRSNTFAPIVLAIAGMIAVMPAAYAAGCDSYGRTAKAQQRENRDLGCGFRGERWHTNKTAHKLFCLAVGENIADDETALRESRLQQCRVARAGERFQDNEEISNGTNGRFQNNEVVIIGNTNN